MADLWQHFKGNRAHALIKQKPTLDSGLAKKEFISMEISIEKDSFLNQPQSQKKHRLTLADIAKEPCSALQDCLLIMHSKRPSDWEKQFAQAAYKRQLWRLEHHWLVPPNQRCPTEKEETIIRRILRKRGLDKINLMDFLHAS